MSRVTIIGRQVLDEQALLSALSIEPAQGGELWVHDSDAGAPALIAEAAGRICYRSFGKAQGRKSTVDYIENIITSGHFSVLEHVTWVFLLTGFSRALTHELVRHRFLSVSQESQRYVPHRREHVIPKAIADCPQALAALELLHKQAAEAYSKIEAALFIALTENPYGRKTLARKASREAARYALPNSTATSLVVTTNARALRDILLLRGSAAALPEMRELMLEWLTTMKSESPVLFSDLEIDNGIITQRAVSDKGEE